MTEQVSLGSWGEEKGRGLERFGIRGGILVLVCSLSPWKLSLLGHLPQTLGWQVSSLKEHQNHLEGFVHWLPDTLPRVSDPKVLGGTWDSGPAASPTWFSVGSGIAALTWESWASESFLGWTHWGLEAFPLEKVPFPAFPQEGLSLV